MKLLNKLLLLFLVLLIVGACEKQDDGSYVPPITRFEKIYGTWKLTAIKQTDEIAKANGAKPDELVLTTKFNFNTFQITFNVDSSSGTIKPTTFKVSGSAPELFASEGYWDMDTPFARTDGKPSKILLYSDEAKTNLVDMLELTAVPTTKKTMELRLVRTDEKDIPYLSYTFSLKQ